MGASSQYIRHVDSPAERDGPGISLPAELVAAVGRAPGAEG